MAINQSCYKCGKSFITSVSSGKIACDDCDGTNAAKKKEAERWAALTPDQKCDELLEMVKGLKQRSAWDGRIG